MARIRSIKPGFFTSEDVSALPIRARLTWIGLWTHCDDSGRAKDNVKLIKAAVWPLDPMSLREIEEDLATLAAHGRIVRYEVDGRRYLAVTNWGDHQKPNKPTPSRIPAPPQTPSPPPPPTGSEHGPVDNWGESYPQDAPPSTGESDIECESDSRNAPVVLREDSRTTPVGRGGERRGVGEVSPRARTLEATRWLHNRYRLTDHEVEQVLAEVEARARAPIIHLIPYLDGMAEGDLADIVKAVLDAAEHDPADPAAPDWCGECDENTRLLGQDRPRRCPTCHPLRDQEVS